MILEIFTKNHWSTAMSANNWDCKMKIYCLKRKLLYFTWRMLKIVGCTQKNHNPPRCDQTHSNVGGIGLVAPWRVFLFFVSFKPFWTYFFLSQLLLMHKICDIGKCDNKLGINQHQCFQITEIRNCIYIAWINTKNAKNWDRKLLIYCMERKSRLQCLQGNIGWKWQIRGLQGIIGK